MKRLKLLFISMMCFFPFLFCTSVAQTNLALNRAAYHSSAANYSNTAHLATDGHLSTWWESGDSDTAWIYVDLGSVCTISEIKPVWGSTYATRFSVQVSVDGRSENPLNWKDCFDENSGTGKNGSIKLKGEKARFVRLNCLKKSGQGGYVLSEFEIYGTGNHQPSVSQKQETPKDGKLSLNGGNWKLMRQSFVEEDGGKISKSSFNDSNWIPATVPGTVLTSYYNLDAIPDPLFGDQQLQISEDYFTSNFWYRKTFQIPAEFAGKKLWLNFDGINWKAEIFVDGVKAGRIEGAYIRGKFDITGFVKEGGEHTLAILIYKNDNPGAVTEQHLKDPDGNGGIIGLDSPTILASIGWNWIPTIRGRNTGIWSNVFLSTTEAVSILDPFVKTEFNLPDTTQSDLSLEVALQNSSNADVNGVLVGNFNSVQFEHPVTLKANETKTVYLDKKSFPQLSVKNPKLWWPNGYGNQNLETVNIQFRVGGKISDQKDVVFGFRKYTYTVNSGNLSLSVNGVPVVVRGGNWGMPEAMLRCSPERYDLLVRLHREMNFNMIRNWIGMTGDDAFYESCDKYGLMIWDDFWLANPVDGPHPSNNNMFIDNVADKIKRRRNNASLAIWCGRNEGYPPAVLDSSMRVCLSELDNSRYYVSSSAHLPVTGLGPYETKSPTWYFRNRGETFHTEQGIVAFPSIETLKEMMPEKNWWPINDMWGKHDWTQPRVQIFTDDMNRLYGQANSLEDFCRKAQFLNYAGPKAMMETWQSKRGGGVLLWMSHPAWPSLICQTYDYYFEPTAAFFAIKKGSEPLHVFWRSDNDDVQVSNNLNKSFSDYTVKSFLYDFSGKLVSERKVKSNLQPNSTATFFKMEFPETISQVHFIKLQLTDKNGNVVSDNFYWRSKNDGDFKTLIELPQAVISAQSISAGKPENGKLKVTIKNSSSQIALLIRLKLVQSESGKRVLPVFYSDNYFSLVPGEVKEVEISFDKKELDGNQPELKMEGWNIQTQNVEIKNL